MTFEQIQEVLTNGVTSGTEVGVCNGINALTTATQKTAATGEAEDLSGLVASVKDASDTTHAVYLTKIDASFLAIVAIAGLMGIQIHDNLKTENPELWAELNNFRQSRYFKTFIGSPDEIASRVIQSIEEVEDGAPAILTNDGKLYISGDMIEQAFSTFKTLGFFERGIPSFEFADMPAATTTYNRADFLAIYGTSFAIVEAYYNSIWADLKTALANRNIDNYNGYEAAAVQSFNSFTDYWAKCKELDSSRCDTIEQYMNFGTITSKYSSGDGVRIDFETLFTFCTVQQNNITVGYSDYTSEKVWNFGNSSNAFTKRKMTLSLNNGTYTVNTRDYSGYCEVRRYNNPSYPVRLFIDTNAFPISATSPGGDIPSGITQEEGAAMPSSDDVSFTAWASSNLSALWDARLISIAPPTFNIAQHNQNWYNVMLPYSLGYDTELNGEEEEPTGGAITQQDVTTITQEEENETAGIEDTGTNTEDFNAYYEAKEGSQKETQGQEDSGEVEEDTQETEDYKASGSTAIYVPTRAQLQSIFNWLWSDNFIENVKKYFQDPAEAMIGLYKCYMPFTPDGSATVVFGRVSSGVSAATTHKYHTWSSGAIQVQKFYNNYLDYKAECSIYIPFFGFNNIDLRDILGSTVEVKIKWEMMTGSALAELWVTRDNMSAPLYIWQGNVFESIPFSASNQSSYQLGVLSMLGKTASGAVSGMVASGGNPLAALGAGALGAAGGLAGLHNSQHVTQGGSITGNSGALGPKKPFITIRYPKNNTPAGFKQFDGNGTDTVGKIGSFTGFIKCREVRLNGIPGATSDSIENIRNLLLEGVYV